MERVARGHATLRYRTDRTRPVSETPPAVTEGTLFDGSVRFSQFSSGYRAAVDGLLLAYFARPVPVNASLTPPIRPRLAVDLGAGARMVSLGLLAHERAARVLAIESHAPTAALLARNLADNAWSERATVAVGSVDVIARSFRGGADLVLANPPYFTRGSSTESHDSDHERAVRSDDPLGPFVRAARMLLGRAARACFVFPSRDLEVLLSRLAAKDLHARRIVFVHPRTSEPASRVLVECSVGRAGGLVVDAPWILYDAVDNGARFEESALLRAVTRARQTRCKAVDPTTAQA